MKKQGFTSRHTQEAETTAAADGIVRSFAPLNCLLEQVWGCQAPEQLSIDNESAEYVIHEGVARKLLHDCVGDGR